MVHFCPVSQKSEFHMTDGCAIFRNTAHSAFMCNGFIAKTKQFLNGVHKITIMKRRPWAPDSNIPCCFEDALDPYMPAGFGLNAEDVWSHPVDEKKINTFRFSPYSLQTVDLYKYYLWTPFLDVEQIPHEHCTNIFISKTGCFFSTTWCGSQPV